MEVFKMLGPLIVDTGMSGTGYCPNFTPVHAQFYPLEQVVTEYFSGHISH